MEIVIIEDEDLAAESLEKMLLKIDASLTVVKRLESVEESIAWFKNNTCQLILSDIHLGDGESFEIFETLNLNIPIIFTTAFDQYAIQSFQFYAIDYLLKPYDKEKLKNAIQKYQNYNNSSQHTNLAALEKLLTNLKYAQQDPITEQERFLVTRGETLLSITSNEIAYFMAENKSLFLFTHQGDSFLYEDTLSSLEPKLSKKRFFKINRKYIVSHLAIKSIVKYSQSRLKIELQPNNNTKDLILVSANYINAFKDWLNH